MLCECNKQVEWSNLVLLEFPKANEVTIFVCKFISRIYKTYGSSLSNADNNAHLHVIPNVKDINEATTFM